MTELNELILEQLLWIIGGLTLLTVILLIVSIAQGAKLRKFKRKYEAMMAGSGVEDLESLYTDGGVVKWYNCNGNQYDSFSKC